MIKSMTAFGRGVCSSPEEDIVVEVRSVNSRFFDCTVRLPRSLSVLEERIKTYVQQNAVSRAKVEVSVVWDRHTTEDAEVRVDTGLARAYVTALRELRDALALPDDITVMRVAENRDLFTYTRKNEDADTAWEKLLPVLGTAVRDYVATREAEGRRTEEDIRAKLDAVRRAAAEVEAFSRENIAGYRDRLEGRLRQILGDTGVVPDEGRLLTECAIFADRMAIDEELARLRSHLGAFDEICRAPEPAGRKLDFLMQEMNRETNTIGSKSANAAIARLVVDMKGELEKIREQIQNIE